MERATIEGHAAADPTRGAAEHGFTLVETLATMVLAVFTLLALHSTAQSAIAGRKSLQRTQQAHLMATEFLDRIRQLPFGRDTDPEPTADELTELFDDDQTLGPITLHQLAVAPDQPGRTFTAASNGLIGTWRVKVCNDLDGDGATTGPREGRSDLMRVQVWFDGQLVVETMRAAEVFETIPD